MDGQTNPEQVVRALRQNNPDISAAVIATADGFAVASDTAPEVSADMLAALGTDLLTRASRSAVEFGRGALDELYFRGADGYLIVMRGPQGQALVCLANPNVTLGLLLVDVRKSVKQLS